MTPEQEARFALLDRRFQREEERHNRLQRMRTVSTTAASPGWRAAFFNPDYGDCEDEKALGFPGDDAPYYLLPIVMWVTLRALKEDQHPTWVNETYMPCVTERGTLYLADIERHLFAVVAPGDSLEGLWDLARHEIRVYRRGWGEHEEYLDLKELKKEEQEQRAREFGSVLDRFRSGLAAGAK